MLGILANLGAEDRYSAVDSIVNEIDRSESSELTKQKYFKQIRIFAQLRSDIEPQLSKIMQSVSTFFKVEKDVFYKLGERKGVEKGMAQGIDKGIAQGIDKGIAQGIEKGEKKKAFEIAANLKQKGFPTKEITELTGLTEEQIEAL